MRRLSVAVPRRSVSSSTVAQKQVGQTIVQFAAGQAALRHLVPARVLVAAVEQVLQAVGVERAAHPARRPGGDRTGGLEVGRLRGAMGHRLRHFRPALGAHLDHELVPAVADHLGQREVEARARLRPGPHRRAEAGAGGGAAVHGEHEGGLAARAVGRIDEGPAEEDAVLDEDGGELAGPHAHERVARGGRRLGLGHEAGLRATGPPAHDRRRVQVALPRVGTDRVAEEGSVLAATQAVPAPVLLVGEADGQVLRRVDLVEDDGAVAHGGTEQRVAALAKSAEESVELTSLDDQGVARFHQGPSCSREGRANETPCAARHQTDRSGRWRRRGTTCFAVRGGWARKTDALRRATPRR